MGFEARNISVLAYANNFTMWHYKTEDTLEDVKRVGYFNNASSMLRRNDLIILNTKDHNTSVWVKSVKVLADLKEDKEYLEVEVTEESGV